MRQADKKYFGDVQQGRLNSDDSPFVLGTNEWVNAENIRTGSSDKGFTGIVESVGGNTELPPPPSAKAYFLNIDLSSVNGYFQLGTTPSTSISNTTSITNSISASFLTEAGEPGVTNIDEGTWNFYVPLSNFQSTTTPIVYAEIYIYPLSGVPYLISTTNSVSINNNSFSKVYNFTANITSQTISSTDRFFIKIIGTNITGATANVVIFPQNGFVSNWYCYGLTNIANAIYDYTTIGSVEDTENNRVLYFNYDNSALRQDRITCLDLNDNKQYNVVLSSQINSSKYSSIEYTYDRRYTLTNLQLATTQAYNMVFSASSKTITITPLLLNVLVDINLNIGDEFYNSGGTLNNRFFTVVNIIRNPELTIITVAENIVNETVSAGIFQYLNQFSLPNNATTIDFLNFIKTGYKIEITNGIFSGTYIVQDSSVQDFIFYLTSNIFTIGLTPSATINVYTPSVIYGEGGLNFSKYSLIHSAKISNVNILSWVNDTNNEPRKINIESGILSNDSSFNTVEKRYEFPLSFSEITLIKPPPALPPIIKKENKANTSNFIRFESFEFAFQFIYNNNEVTVPGTYSLATRLNNTLETEQFNAISITMSYGQDIPSTVKIINLICRTSDGTPIGGISASVIYKWEKANASQSIQIDEHNNNTNALNYIFYNDISGEALPSDDVLRAFDNVPIFSQTHEVSKSRYFLANNIEGYNTPNETSLYGNISSSFITNAVSQQVKAQTIKVGLYKRGRGDKWSATAWYIYINNISGQRTGYYLVNSTIVYDPGSANANTPNALPNPVNFTGMTWVGLSYTDIANYIMNRFGRGGALNLGNGGILDRLGTATIILTGFTPNVYATIANDSKYRLGIVFYDYAMRKNGVCVSNNNPQNYYKVIDNLFIPNTVGNGINTIVLGNYLILAFNSFQSDIIANDIISITNSTSFNGIYTVAKVYSKFVSSSPSSTVYKLQITTPTVPTNTITNESGNITVFRNQGLEINSPVRDYEYSVGYGEIQWNLNNVNNTQQIPEWAYYYSVVKTLNLRTRFFLESNTGTGGLTYVLKNADGTFNYGTPNRNYTTTGVVAIGINTTNINYGGLGYTFSEGDVCTLILRLGQIYSIPIIGQYGNFIHLQTTDLGYLPTIAAFQIYTPYKTSEQEPYYEFAQTLPINNAGTPIRSFSQTNGIIPVDSYILQRNAPPGVTYYANAMSPNDTYWKRYDSDAGKVNIITRLGQTDKNTSITWSDTYISGTQINGSSTFRLGSETFVSDDCGSITKLQLTSKVQDQGQGSVMLALCNSEINSMYLGETQIADSTGKTQFFSASTSVVSTINILKGNYGCISPESVVQYRGKVYFVDLSNGRVVQYSDNGLDAISNVKMSKFWKNWSYKYQSMTKAQIEELGDRPYIFSMVDSGHDELLISLPKLSDDPPKGFLPDYPNTVYPFDTLDYQGKTMVFCLGTAAQLYPQIGRAHV